MVSKGIIKIKNKVINSIIQQIPDAYHTTKEFKIQKSFASLTKSPGTNIMNNYQNYSVKLINNKQHEKQKQRLVLKNIYIYIYIYIYTGIH